MPPGMYEEVRAHLQKKLNLGTIRPSNSKWPIPAVLMRKGDSILYFCIVLRKLNGKAVKASCNIPRIEVTLDYLHGAMALTLFHLQSSCCQGEM